jgi:hypothetical protein
MGCGCNKKKAPKPSNNIKNIKSSNGNITDSSKKSSLIKLPVKKIKK